MDSRKLLAGLGVTGSDRAVNIHVDDLGMCQATLPAFADLWQRGIVSSGSVMVPCPWFPEAARFCRRHPDADVGVHLTLTSEWQSYRWGPVSTRDPASGLVDEKGYLPATRKALHQRAAPETVAREMVAQLERALAEGIEATHLDSHMYAVAHPELMPLYVELALGRGLVPLLWRVGGGAPWCRPDRARELLQKWRRQGVPVPDHLAVLPRGDSRRQRLERVRRLFDGTAGLIHLAVHPAVDTPELQAITPDWRHRVAEYETLSDPAFGEILERSGIRRIGYRELRHAMRRAGGAPEAAALRDGR